LFAWGAPVNSLSAAWPTPQQGATKTVEVDQTAERKSAERRPSDASDDSVPALLDEYTSEDSSGDETEPRPPSKPAAG
jgi:hypothetical protein